MKENRRRDALVAEGKDVQSMGVVEGDEGEEKIVDNNQLDLTDRENLTFRYVL